MRKRAPAQSPPERGGVQGGGSGQHLARPPPQVNGARRWGLGRWHHAETPSLRRPSRLGMSAGPSVQRDGDPSADRADGSQEELAQATVGAVRPNLPTAGRSEGRLPRTLLAWGGCLCSLQGLTDWGSPHAGKPPLSPCSPSNTNVVQKHPPS